MRLRLTKIDEYQFLTCLKHSLWGSKSARFKDWRIGDKLAFIVDKALAALAEVCGEPFESRDKVWENGLYPHHVPIRFLHVLAPQDRPAILGEVRDVLIRQWGQNYGWGILNQQVLESPESDLVANALISRSNALVEYRQTLDERLDEARIQRDKIAERRLIERISAMSKNILNN
ncbi:MAG: hypothetical protein N2572_06225 [Syntrophales bacterium]|nr:hypothetical protein [Syntrophales bacterium]